MEAVYLDLHIHTSANPDNLNEDYDIGTLLTGVRAQANGHPFLISLTDHNTVNKQAYLELCESLGENESIMLGVEVHIRNYEEADPYHCHLYFDLPITEDAIDKINRILDNLYEAKQVGTNDELPDLESIVRGFDGLGIIAVPHGGQAHSTFDSSLPPEGDIKFDSVMERTLYYNQFDGFSGRAESGSERTLAYFSRLGISRFVNLVTGSDNYVPANYPEPKANDASAFVPTWMFAQPTFSGLKLSLSDSGRLFYGQEPPPRHQDIIKSAKLDNDFADIDVQFDSGLNVVIGSASTGKTLLVDSIVRKLEGNSFEDSLYSKLGASDIQVSNPAGMKPHYIGQSFITTVTGMINVDSGFDSVGIFKRIFPSKTDIMQPMSQKLNSLQDDISSLVSAAKETEDASECLGRIRHPIHLVTSEVQDINPANLMQKAINESELSDYSIENLEELETNLSNIHNTLKRHPLADNLDGEFERLQQEITKVQIITRLDDDIREVVNTCCENIEEQNEDISEQGKIRRSDLRELNSNVSRYLDNQVAYKAIFKKVSTTYNEKSGSQEVPHGGYKLITQHDLSLTKKSIIEAINSMLRSKYKIDPEGDSSAKDLAIGKFSGNIIRDGSYATLTVTLMNRLREKNNVSYQIVTSNEESWGDLSPGRKAAVVLDLILLYSKDTATLIIDQPEDNLASDYLSGGLVRSIKKAKEQRQIIVVTHDSTIPILGDADRVIVCKNDGKIVLRDAPLEGEIEGKRVLDYVAELTDGGKHAVKQRYKKYDLKSYKEEQ